MASQKSDSDLVEGYLVGNTEANRYVEDSIEISFWSWRNRFGYQTDDILSDVRFKLLISLRQGDFAGKASLKSYISGIVRHTCLDYKRAQDRIKTVDIEENPPTDTALSAQERLEKRDEAMLIYRVLRLVPKECLKLWKWQLKEGLKYRAIAERMGKSEGNVRSKLFNCRKKAREFREKLLKKEQRLGR